MSDDAQCTRYVIIAPKDGLTVPERVRVALDTRVVLGPFDTLDAAVAYLKAAQSTTLHGIKHLVAPTDPPSLIVDAAAE